MNIIVLNIVLVLILILILITTLFMYLMDACSFFHKFLSQNK